VDKKGESAKLSTSLVIHVSKKKPIFNIRLKSNPSTGYRWYVNRYNQHLIEVIREKFTPSKPQLMGAGGITEWQFRVLPRALKASHRMQIEMIYARSWEFQKGTKKVFQVVT